MKFGVSSLGFVEGHMCDMKNIAGDMGIEIFVEWAPEGFFDHTLPEILSGRTGELSLHAPFVHCDISAPGSDEAALDPLIRPLELCRRYPVSAYVVHTNTPCTHELSLQEAGERRERAERRLLLLDGEVRKAGTVMLVENLGFGGGKKHIYTQEQFLQIFRRNPSLSCIIDIGHAVVENYDIGTIQQELGSRIRAYHLHNNDGVNDSHRRVRDGRLDLACFMSGVRRYTPDAAMIFEYADYYPAAVYDEDRDHLEKLF